MTPGCGRYKRFVTDSGLVEVFQTVSPRFQSYGFLPEPSFKSYADCTATIWYASYFGSEGDHGSRPLSL